MKLMGSHIHTKKDMKVEEGQLGEEREIIMAGGEEEKVTGVMYIFNYIYVWYVYLCIHECMCPQRMEVQIP